MLDQGILNINSAILHIRYLPICVILKAGGTPESDCLFVYGPNLKHDKLTYRTIFGTPVFNNMAQLQAVARKSKFGFQFDREKSHYCASISILYL